MPPNAAQVISVWFQGTLAYGLTLAVTFLVLGVMETAWPREGAPPIPWAARLRALRFWVVWTPINAAMVVGLGLAWRATGVKPLLPLAAVTQGLGPLSRPAGLVAAAIVAAFVGDFFYYWCHRFQHRFLWRFHAVHHAPRVLHGAAGYHHVSEAAMKFVLYTIPLAFLTDDPMNVPVLGGLLGLQGHYLHAATRVNLRPFGAFGRLFQDNCTHRIHHSIQPEHHDRNFGVFTTVWDHLFGTAYVPAPGEWPDTGVAEMPEPTTIGEFLAAPWRLQPPAAETPLPASPSPVISPR